MKKDTIRKPRGKKIRPRVEKPKKKPSKVRKPTLIGYMRVSTDKQDHALQFDALIEHGVKEENIYSDIISGSKISRKGLNDCLKQLVSGDTLLVWKIDRLSRSLKDLLIELDKLDNMDVGFRAITQAIDTTTPAGRMMMHMIGAFAEFEREMIRERVKAGIKTKMDNGRERWGRMPKTEYEPEAIDALRAKGYTVGKIAREIGVSKATVSRVLNREKES